MQNPPRRIPFAYSGNVREEVATGAAIGFKPFAHSGAPRVVRAGKMLYLHSEAFRAVSTCATGCTAFQVLKHLRARPAPPLATDNSTKTYSHHHAVALAGLALLPRLSHSAS